MSGLPIPDPVSLGKSLKDFIAYWRNFRGKKIRIIGPSSSSINHDDHGIEFHTFKEIIEGEVGDVLAYPPGILLKHIEQFVKHEWSQPLYVVGQIEPADWYYNANDSTERESFEIKFVSFNFINAVEFLES